MSRLSDFMRVIPVSVTFLLLSACYGCQGEPPQPTSSSRPEAAGIEVSDDTSRAADATPTSSSPGGVVDVASLPIFYRKARFMGLAGSEAQDSVVLTAYGEDPDSLAVGMRFYVDGQEAFARGWWSSYEFVDQDSIRADTALARSYVVGRFDSELTWVELAPLDTTVLRDSDDPELIDRIQPRPVQFVFFRYGYESTVGLVYNPIAGRFEKLLECC